MIIGDNNTFYPLEKTNMSTYPNILTPPSSSEDSPQPVYFVASPTSSSFHGPEGYVSPISSFGIPESETVVDPYLVMEAQPAGATLHLVEQPTDRFRFRYKSEMAGTHGSLTGMSSDKSRKQTYPTVELHNFTTGSAIIRCSIYQNNAIGKDFMPHAHRLIMKKGKEEQDDPHDLVIGPEDGYRAVFHGMGIIHTAKKNIVSELTRKKVQLKQESIARIEGKMRELTTKELVEIKGLAESESKSINLNIVCLRFDAFVKQNGVLFPICEPIYSHGINNLKSALTGDLKIVRLDFCVSPAKGNKEIFILVERVTKKNIKIRFFELDDNDRVVWEDYGRFNDLDVHHQYAIVFKTPKYRDENITSPVNVFIELVRPSDNARSEPRDFRYIPNKTLFKQGNKRARYDYSSSSYDSSNIGSEELPAVINELTLENTNNPLNNLSIPSGLSEELQKAMQNIDSDEFKKIFTENLEEYTSIVMSTDAPKSSQSRMQSVKGMIQSRKLNWSSSRIEQDSLPSTHNAIKMEVSKEDKLMAERHIKELRSFLKTSRNPNKAVEFLNYYLGEDKKTNALHISICQKDNESAMFLLKIMAYYRQFDLIGKENADNQTALHLAVLCHNELLVKSLLLCHAKVSALDAELNTSLHLAVKCHVSKKMLDLLLTDRNCERVAKYIDMTNSDGDTALIIAIEKNNIMAVNLLCGRKASINQIHPKNGFVPLRFAIEKQYSEAIKYLLSLPALDATIKDFTNVSPFSAALQKESPKEILDMVRKYMNDRGMSVEVKEEVEDESEDEMEIDEDDVKPPIPLDELEKLYEECNSFNPRYLEEISTLLDISENWGSLSQLLEVDHLISSGLIRSEGSMSKALLTYCVETNHDSLWMIRNFLENLDEFRVVQIMDQMVREGKN
ncbi:nuclear factor NF-kappa-B family member relish isoform X2 [Leptinotarsa decemlineata]|uniref:nuclear factor NF-kappa-B family member relish isoform X2 n=1 Tax=Leptinotarsa decemlineata TaxID=7539 RepID=UPI003D308E13